MVVRRRETWPSGRKIPHNILRCYASAHLQFSIHLISPFLNEFIKKKFPEMKEMNYQSCCRFIYTNARDFFKPEEANRKRKRFFKALQLVKEVGNTKLNLKNFAAYIDCLCTVAITLQRRDVKYEIHIFETNDVWPYAYCRGHFPYHRTPLNS
jgi:hypothetical protein